MVLWHPPPSALSLCVLVALIVPPSTVLSPFPLASSWAWETHHQHTKVDLSCGLVDTLKAVLEQLEGQQQLPSSQVLRSWKQEDILPVVSEYTNRLDTIPGLPPSLTQYDGLVSAVGGYIFRHGQGYRWFCNERWSQFFVNQKEAYQRLRGNDGVNPWYLLLR